MYITVQLGKQLLPHNNNINKMAESFAEKHGYQQNTYENKLTSQGYNLADVKAQVGAWGNNMNPGEYQKAISQLGPSPIQAQGQAAQQQLQTIASQQYEFDPQQFLPGIQQQAQGVFAPQQAQLEALRQLQSSQYQEQTLTTNEQFETQLQSEIESINDRGAFFGGGAIQREQEIGDVKLRALNQLGLQAQAADFNNLMQQGLLASEESAFIQDRLYNAESGAYARWSDNRNFSYQAALQQYNIYQDERDFARNVFESDRSFELSSEQADRQQKQFEQTYNITSEQFEQSKEQFNLDMKVKGLSYEKALENFKSGTALTNTGLFGNVGGQDTMDLLSGMYNFMTGEQSNPNLQTQPSLPSGDGGIIDYDN